MDKKIYEIIKKQIENLFYLYLPKEEWDDIGMITDIKKQVIDEICMRVGDDLIALREKDPAANELEYVFNSYLSFRAVVYYRMANAIYYEKTLEEIKRRQISRLISEEAKVKTHVEIHPAAQIGKRFVIDHGVGSVIGETAIIGDNCYLLQGVIIGSRRIANNKPGKRHPTIGNNVQIGGGARILGPINIGDDVVINPNCVVTTNIPSQTVVSISNQMQIMYNKDREKVLIYGVIPKSNDKIEIHGRNLTKPRVYLVDENNSIILGVQLEVTTIEDSVICLTIKFTEEKKSPECKKMNIRIDFEDDFQIIIIEAVALGREGYKEQIG